ncbi:succinate-semialdehyde dehydrogenase [Mycobacterium saskatchewanense]|uniref:Succinate-semialdehyde dehydrogenase n=1 Tax=Mycobacterium saskatchewanense TaxID=220927 RepID=A0AAJ3NQT8_9MYCO|nr:aldehyde dehydrogenase family protein [Mycobacterium saskatchewanense]ORW71893.1 succinate-semialdehyde dehydrogenase [Mycobacterium saskatchewanense]BBX62000.1 succinate-semialdehyde dehydrogenase [Mycobacterium saskatchewanense]
MSSYVVTDPATGEIVETFPEATDGQIESALQAAASAATSWGRSTAPAERASLLRAVAELHRERRDELARIIVTEMGKPFADSAAEVDFSADIYTYYAQHGEALLADEPVNLGPDAEGTAVVKRAPLGPLLGIMPWNFPYYQVARFAAPNLMIGNTIVLKHAPQCPSSAAAIQKIYDDVGFPSGCYVNVYATNEQAAAMIADPRITGVSLTGSERAGAAVAEVAGRNLKKVVLELGGSDPFILLSTGDLDAVVDAAVAARLDNTGQSCNAAKRFIVIDELYDEFLERFTAKMLAAGSDDLAPLSSVAAASRLAAQIRQAVDAGAQFVAAGERHGAFFPPGVLTGVTADSDAYLQEFFGPVAMVFRVGSEKEAISVANDTPYGLGSYVFTTDREQAYRVADRIDAGMVYINGVSLDQAETPFGGVKRSGFGRELGRYGMDEFVNKKLVRSLI